MVIRIETHKCEVSPQFYHYWFAYAGWSWGGYALFCQKSEGEE